MTYYRRASEYQRNDQELRDAVKAELKELYEILSSAQSDLQRALAKLLDAVMLEEDELDQSSGLIEARIAIRSAINKFNYKVKSNPTETYVGNVAAFMSAEKAEELKEKYRAG